MQTKNDENLKIYKVLISDLKKLIKVLDTVVREEGQKIFDFKNDRNVMKGME